MSYDLFFQTRPGAAASTLEAFRAYLASRPHTFALEAARELEAFIAHFDLWVSDPHAPDYTALVQRIAATDRIIDQIVYQLYGLTEEEIAIVES